jgi:hypothetical protein
MDGYRQQVRKTLYSVHSADFLYKRSQRKTCEVLTAIAIDTGENSSISLILIQSSWHRRRLRFATSNYRYNLNREPPSIVFLAVFFCLNCRGHLKQ